MIIQIELLIVLAVMFILFVWFVWFKITNIINRKKYNPENDKGRKAEERRRAEIGNKRIDHLGRESSTAGFGNERFGEHEERILLPTTKTIVDGKTSDGDGKVGEQYKTVRRRNLFKRR